MGNNIPIKDNGAATMPANQLPIGVRNRSHSFQALHQSSAMTNTQATLAPDNPKLGDEDGRHRALSRYNILDTPDEQPFEDIVDLVKMTLDVPFCAVSLIDEDRQWLKAFRGAIERELPRKTSFCHHAIKQYTPFIVEDATKDDIFHQNPLVIDEPHIRSYIGIPLTSYDGYNLGSLCAIDTNPRYFTDRDISTLMAFARLVLNELELRHVADTDGLTGVLSRSAWMKAAETEFSRDKRYHHGVALAILDIDHFKSINDTFGHNTGDKILKHFASQIGESLRDTDMLGRYGGEEFVIVLPENTEQNAIDAVARIRSRLNDNPYRVDNDTQKTVKFSAGIAMRRDDEAVLDTLKRADKALYRAKENGRDRTERAQDSLK